MKLARRRRMFTILLNDRWCPNLRHEPSKQQGHCATQNNFASPAKGNFQAAGGRVFNYPGSNIPDVTFTCDSCQFKGVGGEDESDEGRRSAFA